jgi:hypothetical protein
MPITQALCNSFKRDLLAMAPHRPEDAYKIALYTSRASLNEATQRYSAVDEVPESGDYVAGGQALKGFTVSLDGATATLDWTMDPLWRQATIAAAGALIYNSSRENRALAVLGFVDEAGRPIVVTSTNGTFAVELPAPRAETALIRIR